ncbi:DNA polymerase III subunit gamma and tau [Boudabousia marimammalium]|uniref:DNA-directed DNA polymerase n=1 Tax=Boudabousia marimammalium TaxID=156892 RepID=A0A1Q5PT20_9ACTO|nr:DNA polymerase III subunit gamma and tau [Boudabousia marimammalium]OKL50698.1 DNA polymerase III, subunit gamma and tau [Boudabousia marimammalium]
MSTALYRRYRPQTFDEVIGQEHVTEPLKAALRSGRVNHAYLFSGPRGCGKTTSARILARCLNCVQGPTDTPCGVCDSCRELATGGPGSIDVVEIDAASHNGVEDARSLRERAAFAPARDRFKVFILDEAHMVTPQGFNALLKLVEEPPPHVKFIFATTEPDKVLGTIKSRTHHYPFRLVPPEAMQKYMLQLSELEHIKVGDGVLPLVVRAGGGSVRDSLSVLDQLMAGASDGEINYSRAVALLGYTDAALLDEIVGALAGHDGAAAYEIIERMVESGHDPRRFVEDLLQRLRDLVIIAVAGDATEGVFGSLPSDQVERMLGQARTWGARGLARAADLTAEALTSMSGATSPRLLLELLIARILVAPVQAAAPAGDNSEPARTGGGSVGEANAGGSAKERLMAQLREKRAEAEPSQEQPEAAKSEPAPPQVKQPAGVKPAAEAKPEVPAEKPAEAKTGPATVQAPAPQPQPEPVKTEEKPADPGKSAPAAENHPTSPSVMIRDRWNEVVAAVKLSSRAAWTFISQNTHPGPVYQDVLYLIVPTEGLANPVKRYEHEISHSIFEALGLKLRVEGVTESRLQQIMSDLKAAPAPSASATPGAPAAPKQQAPARAEQVKPAQSRLAQTQPAQSQARPAPTPQSAALAPVTQPRPLRPQNPEPKEDPAPFDDGWGPVAIPGGQQAAQSEPAVPEVKPAAPQPELAPQAVVRQVAVKPVTEAEVASLSAPQPAPQATPIPSAAKVVELAVSPAPVAPTAPSAQEDEAEDDIELDNYSADDFVEFDDDEPTPAETHTFADDEDMPSMYDQDYEEPVPVAGVEVAASILGGSIVDEYIEDASSPNGMRKIRRQGDTAGV